MKIRYQGVLYKYYYQYYPSQTKAVLQPGLHYQGVFYSREICSSDRSPEVSPAKLLSSCNRNFEKIYRLGWQHNQHQHLWRFQYRLLNDAIGDRRNSRRRVRT